MNWLICEHVVIPNYLHPDKLHIFAMNTLWRCIVFSARREAVALVLDDVLIVEVSQNGQE